MNGIEKVCLRGEEMILSIDLVLYIVAAILFAFAGFGVSFGRAEPKWALGWEWLAFCALAISLII